MASILSGNFSGRRAEASSAPISRSLDQQWHDPEAISTMWIAFERAYHLLGLTNAPDAVAGEVAARMLEAALAGERDPVRLKGSARSPYWKSSREESSSPSLFPY